MLKKRVIVRSLRRLQLSASVRCIDSPVRFSEKEWSKCRKKFGKEIGEIKTATITMKVIGQALIVKGKCKICLIDTLTPSITLSVPYVHLAVTSAFKTSSDSSHTRQSFPVAFFRSRRNKVNLLNLTLIHTRRALSLPSTAIVVLVSVQAYPPALRSVTVL